MADALWEEKILIRIAEAIAPVDARRNLNRLIWTHAPDLVRLLRRQRRVLVDRRQILGGKLLRHIALWAFEHETQLRPILAQIGPVHLVERSMHVLPGGRGGSDGRYCSFHRLV